MLGEAGTRKDLSTVDVRRDRYKQPPLRQYIRRGWHKKDLSIVDVRRDRFKQPRLRQYVRWGWHKKEHFTESLLQGLYEKFL